MIPFSIASGKIINEVNSSLEIGILELSMSSFTFRLPHSKEKDYRKLKEICLHFFDYEKQDYREIILQDFHCQLKKRDNFWSSYEVFVEDSFYEEAVAHLSKEYLSYIENRLTLNDSLLSAAMTTYPPDQDDCFCKNLEEQKVYWSTMVKENYQEEKWDDYLRKDDGLCLSMALDCPEKIEEFLQDTPFHFCKKYWNEWKLGWHALANKEIKGIHVGNPFCPHLFPKEKVVLERLFQKAVAYGLTITFVFPPLSQSFFGEFMEVISLIKDLTLKHPVRVRMEWNDDGLKNRLINCPGKWELCPGILMDKSKRDPRNTYRLSHSKDSHADRWEGNKTQDEIFLPFYQMNTSTFCTLYSLCKYGNRGKQERVIHCPRYCMNHALLYPKHLNVLGRQNSIVGFSKDSLADPGILLSFKGKEWMVINL